MILSLLIRLIKRSYPLTLSITTLLKSIHILLEAIESFILFLREPIIPTIQQSPESDVNGMNSLQFYVKLRVSLNSKFMRAPSI